MHGLPRRFAFLLLVLGPGAAAGAVSGWQEPNATWRVLLDPVAAGNEEERHRGYRPGDTGFVRLWPQNPGDVEVAIYSGTRRRAAEVLDPRPGHRLEVRFDARGLGDRRLIAYIGTNLKPAPQGWRVRGGLVLESRERARGAPASPEAIRAIWRGSGERHGRATVPAVFHGFNPFGAEHDFCARYDGWLHVPRAGTYRFATASDDASLLTIDGETVCAWPGWHHVWGGRRGEYHGSVDLDPGYHRFRYYHVQGGGDAIATAAWQPPGHRGKRWLVVPPGRFAGMRDYAPSRPVARDGNAAGPPLRWEHLGSCRAGGVELVTLRFVVAEGDAWDLRWRFSVGDEATGPSVERCFVGPGPRRVRIFWRRDEGPGTREFLVAVRPKRCQRHRCPAAVLAGQRAYFDGRRMRSLPRAQLLMILRFAAGLEDLDWQGRIAALVAEKRGDLRPGEAAEILRLGLLCQDHRVGRDDTARVLLGALPAVTGVEPALAARARLHLAGLLIHRFGELATAAAILDAIPAPDLDADDRRLLAIYRADRRFYAGDGSAAVAYRAVGDLVDRGDPTYAARRLARLEAAREQLRQGFPDHAAAALREIEWETPDERMGSRCSLGFAEVWLARGQHHRARLRLEAVLARPGEDPWADRMLACLVRARLGAGDVAGAREAARRLRAEHPYSAAAADLAELDELREDDDAVRP